MPREHTFRIALATSLVLMCVPSIALADDLTIPPLRLQDPNQIPDNPSPPSVPDLTHRALWVGLEMNFASVKPNDLPTGPQARLGGVLVRAEGEVALVERRWYAGLAYEAAWGQSATSRNGAFIFGYPELWMRGVWASSAGLAYGGGLSVVPPIFLSSPDSERSAVAQGVQVVRPWDFAAFTYNQITAVPYIDARVVDGRVTLQLRQGLGLQGAVTSVAAGTPKTSLISRTTMFLGYQPIEALGVGLELWEVYFLSADVPDNQRAAFAVSPSIRLLTRAFQPALSVIVPFDRPLFDRVDSYWAARLTLGAIFDSAPAPIQ